MSISYRKSRIKDVGFKRLVPIAGLGVITLVLVLRANLITTYPTTVATKERLIRVKPTSSDLKLPQQNKLSTFLQKLNLMDPMNIHLYPNLPNNRIVVVLYVHNRPQYLRLAIDSLSRVAGISETLLIVSHDGYYAEMNEIVKSIRFCQVKQIFAPYSPHIFPNSFPGISPLDCKSREDPTRTKCEGTPDHYGNHRSPKIVSLKHHWWWMMNTVWDGLNETRGYSGHVLFIEEDHFIYPNAYRNLQLLIELKREKCPHCYAVNLAPANVLSRGEGWEVLVAEKMGNVGYAFNRTVWRKIHRKAMEFCLFDDYNWDITMWAAVFPSFGEFVYTLRGPRTSAVHFGECGLHQGQGEKNAACTSDANLEFELKDFDEVANVKSDWDVFFRPQRQEYKAGFTGWGGWGDARDQQLCLDFSNMYWVGLRG